MRYILIESRRWERDDGMTASIYGACPWSNDADKARWSIVIVGWTLRDTRNNTVGIGRKPWATRAEAEAHAATLNAN